MDTRELRSVFGLFATGVTVVTCLNTEDDRAHGVTVTAFTPVSLDPPPCSGLPRANVEGLRLPGGTTVRYQHPGRAPGRRRLALRRTTMFAEPRSA